MPQDGIHLGNVIYLNLTPPLYASMYVFREELRNMTITRYLLGMGTWMGTWSNTIVLQH